MIFTGLSEMDVAVLIKQNHPAVGRVVKILLSVILLIQS